MEDSGTSLSPHPTHVVNEAATESPSSRQQAAYTSTNDSPATSSLGSEAITSEAITLPPRLLDSDPSRFRSLKRVIVIGRPGSGTDGIGDALRKLGFKVYDFQTASDRYVRDFPLWLEAARLRHEGRPYNKSDFDKVFGDHDAIVGAPACFFDTDFVEMYAGVKVILVTRDIDQDLTQKLLEKGPSWFWRWVDPAYCGNLANFIEMKSVIDNRYCIKNVQAIRECVRDRNLLEIRNLIAWVPLCEFLGVKVPDSPAPELHDNRTEAEFVARPQRWLLETAKNASQFTIKSLTYFFTMAAVILISILAVCLGGLGLYKLSALSANLFALLLERSQVRDVTRLLAAGTASGTLVCGLVLGYCLALIRHPTVSTVESSARNHQHRFKSSYKRGRQGRSRQTEGGEKTRPERPILNHWSGVQENIRRDDAELREVGLATLEEWKNGKHVTFHVTHKRTETGQDLFSGPRKVLSVTEETL